jgi:hypothetical protein
MQGILYLCLQNNLATPRAYVKGRDFGKTIIDPHTAYLKQASIVVASCTKVSDDSLTLDNGDTLPFDYLALCSGSNYSLFKTSGESKTIEQRLAQFDAESERYDATNS